LEVGLEYPDVKVCCIDDTDPVDKSDAEPIPGGNLMSGIGGFLHFFTEFVSASMRAGNLFCIFIFPLVENYNSANRL